MQVVAFAVACASAAAGGFIASHHPLFPVGASMLFAGWIVVVAWWPRSWLFAVPALLPALGFAMWTGWMAFEEFDLLVLGAAAGGYLRIAARGAARSGTHVPWALTATFGVWSSFALYRGIVDANVDSSNWFGGYYDALNSLRVFKGLALATLLLPLAIAEQRKSENADVIDLVGSGMAVGCAVASMIVVWERVAFPGFFDFSSDYRATGPFWEMHVGGAALDGFLALTLPFVVRESLRARNRWHVVFSVALLLVAGYACLVTFSRGLYAGLLIGGALLVFLMQAANNGNRAKQGPAVSTIGMASLVAVTLFATWLVFNRGGYRAVAAVIGVVAIALLLAPELRRVRAGRWLPAGAAAACVAVIGVFAAAHLPRGPYVLYAVLFVLSAALTLRCRRASDHGYLGAASAFFFALVVAAIGIALNWGGVGAAVDTIAAIALYVALIAGSAFSSTPLWSGDLKTSIRVVATVILFSGAVVVFSAGAYMESRFATSRSDLDVRLAHWRHVVDLLKFPEEWLIGAGLGRLPARYFYDVHTADFPGSYTLADDVGRRLLVVAGPRHVHGYGELLRISQRIAPVTGRGVHVRVIARAARDARLELAICEKHLLYSAGCVGGVGRLKATYPAWEETSVELDGRQFFGAPSDVVRPMVFSFAVETEGAKLEIASVSVKRDDGVDLIENGDFSSGLSRWFFTSDHEHLPWHAKNLFLNIFFDEGVIGLVLFVALVASALGRLILVVRTRPAAPFIAASIIGFVVVGAFDSLLDVARVAFLFYLVLFVGLTVPRGPHSSHDRSIPRPKRASAA